MTVKERIELENSTNKKRPTRQGRDKPTNVKTLEAARQKKLTLLAQGGDYMSYYYLGKIFAERKLVKDAMECYIQSLKNSSIAAYEMGNLIKKYPKIYKSIIV